MNPAPFANAQEPCFFAMLENKRYKQYTEMFRKEKGAG